MRIHYGFHPTPYGECLLASTERGICFLAFVTDDGRRMALQGMKAEWRRAEWLEDPMRTQRQVQAIFSSGEKSSLQLHIRGTNFQIKVWEALLRIPPGQVASYEVLAEAIGAPSASRAVGHALAQNPIAFLIPCHRVLRKSGDFGHYRYGRARKTAMLLREIG